MKKIENKIFDPVFRSYVQSLKLSASLEDRLTRVPTAFSDCWLQEALKPDQEKTILITGSKGKGTVTRLIAWNLARSDTKVGLVLSPEEINHFDRIRINNIPISKKIFLKYLEKYLPILNKNFSRYTFEKYISPTGIFLTIALAWFKDSNVDYYVIEGGRGVISDEIGQLNADLGVITNIMPEHLSKLGGSIDSVFDDKLSLGKNCKTLLISNQINDILVNKKIILESICNKVIYPSSKVVKKSQDIKKNSNFVPDWKASANELAECALQYIKSNHKFIAYNTPSFFQINFGKTTIFCEPVIHSNSLEFNFLKKIKKANSKILIGLSDDKDTNQVVKTLKHAGLNNLFSINLLSTVDHIHSKWMFESASDVINIGSVNCVEPDLKEFHLLILKLMQDTDILYIIGIQIFIRTIRLIFNIKLVGDNND